LVRRYATGAYGWLSADADALVTPYPVTSHVGADNVDAGVGQQGCERRDSGECVSEITMARTQPEVRRLVMRVRYRFMQSRVDVSLSFVKSSCPHSVACCDTQCHYIHNSFPNRRRRRNQNGKYNQIAVVGFCHQHIQ